MENLGLQNAKKIEKYILGKSDENLLLQIFPCINKSIFIVCREEISELDITTYVRSVLDCDKKMRTYLHNRIIGKNKEDKYIYIGDNTGNYESILGFVIFPN